MREAVQELVHSHFSGPNIKTALFHATVSRVDFPTDLHLAVFVVGVKHAACGYDGSSKE